MALNWWTESERWRRWYWTNVYAVRLYKATKTLTLIIGPGNRLKNTVSPNVMSPSSYDMIQAWYPIMYSFPVHFILLLNYSTILFIYISFRLIATKNDPIQTSEISFEFKMYIINNWLRILLIKPVNPKREYLNHPNMSNIKILRISYH